MRGIGEEYSAARITAHALVSGVSAEIDGGSFVHGFAAAVLSQNIGKNAFFQKGTRTARIMSNAILQGTISEVTGGKFANGAVSAAFRVAFNQLQDNIQRQAIAMKISDGTSEDFLKAYRALSASPKLTINGALRVAGFFGGAGQVALGFTLCGGTAGVGCALGGLALASHGTNNMIEAISGNQDGPVREVYRSYLGESAGDWTYLGVDLGMSAYGYLRGVKSPGEFTQSEMWVGSGSVQNSVST